MPSLRGSHLHRSGHARARRAGEDADGKHDADEPNAEVSRQYGCGHVEFANHKLVSRASPPVCCRRLQMIRMTASTASKLPARTWWKSERSSRKRRQSVKARTDALRASPVRTASSPK